MWLVFPDGRTFRWGISQFAGRPDRQPTVGPQLSTDLLDFQANQYHNCALFAEGGRVRCWGQNDYGQVGNGATGTTREPTEVQGLTGVTEIAAGTSSTWVLRRDLLSYWGSTFPVGETPRPSELREGPLVAGAVRFSTGPIFGALGIVTSDGRAFAWGENSWGGLGDGSTERRLRPVPIMGLRGVSSLSLAATSACAVAEPAGTVWCWGDRYGLFESTRTDPPVRQLVPAPVRGLRDFVQVVVGERFACGLTSTQAVQCWGNNDFGTLGIGSDDVGVLPPGPFVDLPPVRELAVATSAMCALSMADEVYCWGLGSSGAIGRPGQANQRSPVRTFPVSTP